MIDISALIETSVVSAQIESGVPLRWVAANTDQRLAMALARSVQPEVARAQPWSEEERIFIEQNIGILSDREMGLRLGRSAISVKIRRIRKMMGCASRRADYVSARAAATMLGMGCQKRICWLIEQGMLRGIEAPFERRFYQIHVEDLKRFACKPEHWVYFDPTSVRHPHLRRLVLRQMRRWGDEWWDARRVAEYHGVKLTTISHCVSSGRLPGVRHGKWYIRRSDATNPDLIIVAGRGAVQRALSDKLDPLDEFFVTALSLGIAERVVDDLCHHAKGCSCRYLLLRSTGRLSAVAEKYSIPLQFNTRGEAWLPWSAAKGRFPFADRAVVRFVAQRPCRPDACRAVVGILAAWAAFHAVTPAERRFAIRMSTFSMARESGVRNAYATLLTWGKGDPLQGAIRG